MNDKALVQNPLGTERIAPLMVRFAVPSIILLVVYSLYNMVDQIFIGQAVEYLGNSATNVILLLTMMILASGLLLGDGAAANMSLDLGKKKPEEAAISVGNCIFMTVLMGICMMIICKILLLPPCKMFGATGATLTCSLDYGRIIVLGFPFAAIDSAFGSILRADGRPQISMISLLLGCITNAILDALFVFVSRGE